MPTDTEVQHISGTTDQYYKANQSQSQNLSIQIFPIFNFSCVNDMDE